MANAINSVFSKVQRTRKKKLPTFIFPKRRGGNDESPELQTVRILRNKKGACDPTQIPGNLRDCLSKLINHGLVKTKKGKLVLNQSLVRDTANAVGFKF